MKKISLLLLLSASAAAFGQVGINNPNPQGMFHVDGQKNNPTTGVPSLLQQQDDFVVTTNGKVGIGTISPNAKMDIRTNPTSTSDPGEGILGIGTTAVSAPSAGAGALRYSTLSGGQLQYSNGVVWNSLSSTVQKSVVVAEKTTTQTFINNNYTYVNAWSELTDLNSDFNPSTGVFIAPRNGNYSVSFSFNFNVGSIGGVPDGTQVEAILETSSGQFRKSVVAFPAAGNSQAGAAISFVVRMTAGETIRAGIFNSTGYDKTLRVGTGGSSGFNNFSVVEL